LAASERASICASRKVRAMMLASFAERSGYFHHVAQRLDRAGAPIHGRPSEQFRHQARAAGESRVFSQLLAVDDCAENGARQQDVALVFDVDEIAVGVLRRAGDVVLQDLQAAGVDQQLRGRFVFCRRQQRKEEAKEQGGQRRGENEPPVAAKEGVGLQAQFGSAPPARGGLGGTICDGDPLDRVGHHSPARFTFAPYSPADLYVSFPKPGFSEPAEVRRASRGAAPAGRAITSSW
jgi:hypothetical protein